jgi:hypothetical protein
MSLSNATENDALKAFLKGTDPSYRSGATQYLALFTADPGEPGSLAAELTYTGYERVALTKASAWTDGGSSFTNAGLIQFGKRIDAGATQVAQYFAVVDTGPATGTAVNMMISGMLSAPLSISQNIQPQFAIGDLTVTAD